MSISDLHVPLFTIELKNETKPDAKARGFADRALHSMLTQVYWCSDRFYCVYGNGSIIKYDVEHAGDKAKQFRTFIKQPGPGVMVRRLCRVVVVIFLCCRRGCCCSCCCCCFCRRHRCRRCLFCYIRV
jgi:hypothetical protein